jgi:hypothetical protein
VAAVRTTDSLALLALPIKVLPEAIQILAAAAAVVVQQAWVETAPAVVLVAMAVLASRLQ